MNILPMNPLALQLETAVRLLERHSVRADIKLDWSAHSTHPIYSIGDRVLVFGPQSPRSPKELMLLMFNEYHKMKGCHCGA